MNPEVAPQEVNDGVGTGQKVITALVVAVLFVGGYIVFRPANNEAVVSEPTDENLAAIQPIIAGADTYALDGFEWIFEPQALDESGAVTTRVRLKLSGLKRNNSPIEVATYRLGTYRGDCQSFDATKGEALAPTKDALSFAECVWNGTNRQLVVYQEGEALVVKARSLGENGVESQPLTTILTIDIPRIIQPAL
jgi:hypothetical protein